MSNTKKLDLIIWGATGFTGQLVSQYINKTYSSTDLKWGIAGRNKEKILSIANKLNINDISGFVLINAPVVVSFNCVIGDCPMLPKIELTADSSVSVAIGVVIKFLS